MIAPSSLDRAGTHPVKSTSPVSFKNIWCCAESQHFCVNESVGLYVQEAGTSLKDALSIPCLPLPNWHRMSGPGQPLPPLQRMPAETQPLAKAPGLHSDPGLGSKRQDRAKFCRSSSSRLLPGKVSGLLSGNRVSIFEGPSQQQSPGS